MLLYISVPSLQSATVHPYLSSPCLLGIHHTRLWCEANGSLCFLILSTVVRQRPTSRSTGLQCVCYGCAPCGLQACAVTGAPRGTAGASGYHEQLRVDDFRETLRETIVQMYDVNDNDAVIFCIFSKYQKSVFLLFSRDVCV